MGIPERQVSREIDGVTYLVNPLPFGIGHKALLRFTKIAGPIIASAFGQNGAPAAIAAATQAFSEEDMTYFARIFGNASWYVDGPRQVPLVESNQESHFSMRYTAFFEWLALGVEVNFGPFFSDMMKRAGLVVSKAETGTLSASAEKTG